VPFQVRPASRGLAGGSVGIIFCGDSHRNSTNGNHGGGGAPAITLCHSIALSVASLLEISVIKSRGPNEIIGCSTNFLIQSIHLFLPGGWRNFRRARPLKPLEASEGSENVKLDLMFLPTRSVVPVTRPANNSPTCAIPQEWIAETPRRGNRCWDEGPLQYGYRQGSLADGKRCLQSRNMIRFYHEQRESRLLPNKSIKAAP
jgi:hypothetical protein